MTMMVRGIVISLDPQLNFEGWIEWEFPGQCLTNGGSPGLGFVFYVGGCYVTWPCLGFIEGC